MDLKPKTFVEVAVNRPLFKSFVYELDAVPAGATLIGSRVRVNFAGSEDTGIIVGVCPESSVEPSPKIKQARLLDPDGLIPDDIAHTLRFGSRYYHHPLGQCFATALPKKLRDGEKCAYEEIPGLRLAEHQDEAKLKRTKSEEQLKILDLLGHGPLRRKELRERGISSSSENALIKKGLVEICDLNTEVIPWPENASPLLRETPPEPNPEQQAAIDAVTAAEGFHAFLLFGITGAGKTEVYLRVIEQVLARGKAVLVLVPEIALTPQTFERFYRRFNVPVSSMHSQLSDRERLDAYIDMRTRRSGVLIGTRTALFTPIPDLGLIVLDEEHDSSFKQTDGFRYHARSLALVRAERAGCPVILGSATPSLESFHNVSRGIFTMLRLTERAGGASLPECELIDLRKDSLNEGIRAGIGTELEERIGEETARGNQVLLFLNRRGYSHHMLCHNCGHVFTCPSCDNPMTVHRTLGRLKCHVCENVMRIPKRCPCCGEETLMETGFGTEQTEEYLRLRYPDLGIERIDRDTVTTKAQLEERLSRIRSGQSQVLLGTQMVAKGHDFPNVTLVGIIDIDSNLFSDDFHAAEYSAQLLTQVSGRAGRASKRGCVLIQTHHPENLLVNSLIDPDVSYESIAMSMLETRRALNLPPVSSQAFLLANDTDRESAFRFLAEVLARVRALIDNYPGLAVSPVLSDKMEKRQNRYHFHILITAADRRQLSDFIDRVQMTVNDRTEGGKVRFAVEVDPMIMY